MASNLHGKVCSAAEVAEQLAAAGISVTNIRPDGSKASIEEWAKFQQRIPTAEERAAMFSNGAGVAVICGKVSGNLEIVDLEAIADWPDYSKLVEIHRPGLLDRLVHVATPSGGRHLYYRCATIGPGQKLAMRRTEDGKEKVAIETRGEKNYAVTIGSPAACHASNKEYVLLHGDMRDIPTISEHEREILLSCARSFNEVVKPERTYAASTKRPNGSPGDQRPGDEFNANTTWAEILEPAGWKHMGHSGERDLWQRPGKKIGISATSNYAGLDRLYVFSTNAAPFDSDMSYTKFGAFAVLNYGGDFQAAARALAARGDGEQRGRGAVKQFVPANRIANNAGDEVEEGRRQPETLTPPDSPYCPATISHSRNQHGPFFHCWQTPDVISPATESLSR